MKPIRTTILVISAFIAVQSSPDAEAQSHRTAQANSHVSQESPVELSRSGKHFEAISAIEEASNDATIADLIAASRSAWALGLAERSRSYTDRLLANRDFTGSERARALLSRAILELQESQFESARAFAERGAQKIPSSELRAQFWLLIAESLKSQGIFSRAEDYYKRASLEGSEESKAESLYYLGETQRRLGMLEEARHTFTSVPIASQYVGPALRQLMEIDFTERDYEGVLLWHTEGSSAAQALFDDPWTYYAKVTALLELGRLDDASATLTSFKIKHSENNHWYALAEAASEAALIKNLYPSEHDESSTAFKSVSHTIADKHSGEGI
ncbi:MAG: hypothetical protein KDD66_12410 [Bdellovibrionales bacterium]|nr:hypothetical protein [Bdellovibrionales bacterium]